MRRFFFIVGILLGLIAVPVRAQISNPGAFPAGSCVVGTTQTLQACINLFPNGNGDIFIPLGTWTTTSAVTISGNGQSSIHITGAGRGSIIKYTGGGAISAVLDIGTSTPTVQLLSSIILRDFTIEGNANSTHAIRLQGVQTSTLQDIDGRDVAGSALQWLFGTGNRINHWITSATDGIGSFTTVPTGCLELGELGSTTFGFTTTTIDTPRCESVSGTAVLMTNAQANMMSAAQISTVGTALDIEPGAGAVSSLQNSFSSCLFENSTNADGVIVNGLQTHFYDSQIATLGTGKMHIKANNNTIEGGQVGTPGITIDAGVKNTHIKQLSMPPANLTDNGTNTMLTNNWDPTNSLQWQLTVPTFRQVIPASGVVSDLASSDPQDHSVQSCWKFIGTTPTTISTTPLTTGKPWRALLHGVWENDTDGTGLAQLAEEQDVTSVANTLAIGTITVTFSVNGSGQFQGVNSASNTMFCGTIMMNPAPQNVAGTSSLTLKGDIATVRNMSSAQYTSTAAGSSVDFVVVNSNAFRNNSAGGSYFFDLGNVTFRNGDSNPGGTVKVTGPISPTVAGAQDLGTTALPWGNLWLGTAATNNFRFQPPATAAARVITWTDPLANSNLPFTNNTSTTTTQVVHATATAGLYTTAAIATADIATALTTPGPIGGTTPSTGKFTTITETNLLISNTAPTIAGAGCGGSSATIASNNGTAAFTINVGTAPTLGGCTITMPAATTAWNCFVNDITTTSTAVFHQKQTGAASTTSVVLQNFSDVAAATAPTASDIYRVSCFAY